MKKNTYIAIGIIIVIAVVVAVVLTRKNKNSEPLVIPEASQSASSTNQTSTSATTYTPAVPLEGTTFKLVAVNKKLAPTGDYTLSLTSGNISAKFCNGMGGEYTIENFMIKAPMLMGTLMYCEQPEGLMNIEQVFGKMLAAGASATITGDVLELKSGDDHLVWQAK